MLLHNHCALVSKCLICTSVPSLSNWKYMDPTVRNEPQSKKPCRVNEHYKPTDLQNGLHSGIEASRRPVNSTWPRPRPQHIDSFGDKQGFKQKLWKTIFHVGINVQHIPQRRKKLKICWKVCRYSFSYLPKVHPFLHFSATHPTTLWNVVVQYEFSWFPTILALAGDGADKTNSSSQALFLIALHFPHCTSQFMSTFFTGYK